MSSRANKAEQILEEYYKEKGAARNDPLHPEVLFQQLAHRVALLRCFADVPRNARILDVEAVTGTRF